MKACLDCVPCLAHQAVAIARYSTGDPDRQQEIVRAVLRECAQLDFSLPPVRMGQRIHHLARQVAQNPDPYREAKAIQNRDALAMLPELRRLVRAAPDPLAAALRLSAAGNLIDHGPSQGARPADFREAVTRLLEAAAGSAALEQLRAQLPEAGAILILGDNAGEIVLDLLVIEQLARAGIPLERVTYVVRGGPVLNDATMEDAEAVGLTQRVRVIDTGNDAPGILIEQTSEAFRAALAAAELILAKGQGNYETMGEVIAADPPWTRGRLFHLLLVKCPVVARETRLARGTLLIREASRPD